MISWIQKYFQHHFRTVFALLLAVTIISFVFVIGASPGIGQSDRRLVDRMFFDYNLSLPQDQARVFGDAQLSAQMQVGSLGGLDSEQLQSYALTRAASLHLADQWHIPAATTAEIADQIKSLRIFSGQDGQFDAKTYAAFRDNLKTNPRGLNEAEIARVLGDDVRVEKVNKLLSGPGYVLPADIKNQLIRADTSWTLGTATANYGSYKVDVKASDAELTKYFEENSFRYEVPPRVVATQVAFPASAHLAKVTVTEAEVRAHYDENPARFPKPVEVKPADAATPAPKADPAADYAAVRTQVEASLRASKAQKLAVKDASDFALALFDAFKNKMPDEAALQNFLANRKVQQTPIAPFTRDSAPAELGGSREAVAEAFKLNAQRFASEAFATPMGGSVLLWKETQAPRKPTFAEVRDRVASDHLESEKTKRFLEVGKAVRSQIEARLKAGDSFEAAVAAASKSTGLALDVKMIPAFTLRTPPKDLEYGIFGMLDRLEKGQVTDLIRSSEDKATLVFAAEKKLPELSDANPRYAETRNQLAAFASRQSAASYIAEMVQKELKRSEPKVQ